MTRIGIRELRQNASVYLAMVKAGQVVEVTERGRLIATIQAPSAEMTDREEWLASGHLLAAKHHFAMTAQRYPVGGGLSASEVLEESRAERIR